MKRDAATEQPAGEDVADDSNAGRWLVFQLGSREHYAVPRALRQVGVLAALVTDIWHDPKQARGWRGWLTHLTPRLTTRFEPTLADVSTHAFSGWFVVLNIVRRLGAASERWRDLVTGMCDQSFQWLAAKWLARWKVSGDRKGKEAVFAYSYSARQIFQTAERRGYFTVLGQINPGPREEEIVREVYRRELGGTIRAPQAPAAYWRNWREECALADAIVVNSPWSRQLLIEAGVEATKLHVIPLAYVRPEGSESFERAYPDRFTAERPLRVLYLGTVHLRKGILVLLRVAERMAAGGLPVEFLVVGRDEVPGGLATRLPANVRHVVEVDRRATAAFYREADVFVLPTYSDGFALTLLEAQAWKLPAIVSKRCGLVVEDQCNGLVLADLDEDHLEQAIRSCRESPLRLSNMAAHSVNFDDYSLTNIGRQLQSLDVRRSQSKA